MAIRAPDGANKNWSDVAERREKSKLKVET